PYGRVVSDALHVTPQGGTIDVFRAYYDAARTSHTAQQAPHYQFANLKNFEDVVMFLQCFGLPGCPGSLGRQDILLGEFLIAAKRLRYAMEARAALIQGDEERAQASLAKLGFALDFNAHWYFWPAPINPEFEKVDDMTWQERFMEFMQSMARQQP